MGVALRFPGARPAAVAAPQPSTASPAAAVVRFDEHQRLQHALMMGSFIVLALTGLPQKFSDLSLSQWWVDLLGGLQVVRAIHRTAGMIMLIDCLYHLAYLGYRIGVQRRLGPLRMVPTPADARDVLHTLLYFLGVRAEKPQFDRFNYLEKFDYWAVFWGIFMIGGSGIVLTFPVLVSRLLPGQIIPVAMAVHSDEAILAVGWILVVHMFNVHLAPWVFPFNPAIFTGKISAHRCAEDHPLEWQRLTSTASADDVVASTPHRAQAQPEPSPRSRPVIRRGRRFAASVRAKAGALARGAHAPLRRARVLRRRLLRRISRGPGTRRAAS